MLKTTGLRFALTVMMTLLMLGVGSLYAQTANPTQPVMPMGPMYNGTGPGVVMNPATHMGSTNVQPMSSLMLNAHQVPGATNPGAQTSPGLQMPHRGNKGPGMTFNQTAPPTGSGTTNPLMGPALRGPMGPLSPGRMGPAGPMFKR